MSLQRLWKYNASTNRWDVCGDVGCTGGGGGSGPAGADGADGADGLPGATGATGPQGPQGDPGVDGTNGVDGLPGADGVDGLPGADGADGLPGADGADGLPGADGADGLPGADGADGLPGADGADGKTVLSGTGAPTTEGVEGDFYIDTDENNIYGPKTGELWGSPTSLIGADGADGVNGNISTDCQNTVSPPDVLSGPQTPPVSPSEGEIHIEYWQGRDCSGGWSYQEVGNGSEELVFNATSAPAGWNSVDISFADLWEANSLPQLTQGVRIIPANAVAVYITVSAFSAATGSPQGAAISVRDLNSVAPVDQFKDGIKNSYAGAAAFWDGTSGANDDTSSAMTRIIPIDPDATSHVRVWYQVRSSGEASITLNGFWVA